MRSPSQNFYGQHSRASGLRPPVEEPRMPARASAASPAMPPGAIGSRSSAANNYTQMTLESLLNAPSRESQPHLHPRKLNGALWFGIDPEVHKFIKTVWKAYYMGPWCSWNKVPRERRDKWWQTFVQKYYWEDRFKDKGEEDNKKPKFMNDEHWTILKEEWETEAAIANSKAASESRKSNPYGKGMHKHCAGPQTFLKIEYDMMVASGCDEPPSFTDLVRQTHTRKDGTFIHHRAHSIVLEVEEAVSQMTSDDGSPNATPRILLNQEYIKRSQTR